MRNVVITGVGIKSCIGNDYAEVLANLQNAKSGIVFNEKYSEMGFRSCVSGSVNINLSEHIDRKLLRFMGESAGYAYLATKDALRMAGIDESHLDSPKIGIVAGSGGASTRVMLESGDIAREKGHCIGHAADLIKSGQQDVVIAGGSDDEHWSSSCLFDAMGALSSNFNSTPTIASRPYDSNRDGFVISGGAGMIILEDEEHAKKRGANILAKLSGYFANSDGYDMVAPSGEGASRCMQGAIDNSKIKIDYINTHGTSTPVGDVAEINAIKNLFNSETPMISSTKSMTGHSLGATGAHEVIYSIMMINENFIAPSINIESLCDDAEGLDIVTETRNVSINNILSNSFGFGGTNASLVISRY